MSIPRSTVDMRRATGAAFTWLLAAGFFLWAARYTFLEGFWYPIHRGFAGDFHSAVAGFHDIASGVFYGPLFVLEYRLLLQPGHLALEDFAWFNYVLYGAALGCAWFAAFPRFDARLAMVVSGGWFAHRATAVAFTTDAHLELVELCFISVACLLATRALPLAAGVSLGVASMAKMIPCVFIPYLAIMRRWQMLAATLAACGALFLGMCWVQRTAPWGAVMSLFYQEGHASFATGVVYMQSTRAATARLLIGPRSANNSRERDLVLGVHAVFSVVVLAWASTVLARVPQTAGAMPLIIGFLATVTLTVTPTAHIAYFVLLLPAWTAGLATLVHQPLTAKSSVLWAGLIISYVLNGLPQPFTRFNPALGAWWDLHSLAVWSLFPLLAVLAALLLNTPERKSQPTVLCRQPTGL